MLNKAVIAGFLATTAIAFGVATARAELAPVDRDEGTEFRACEQAPAQAVAGESDQGLESA